MTTPRLGLAELLANQSQPHVPVNTAVRRIDALLQATALDVITALPGSPVDGDAYIVADSGTSGALIGKENNFIYYYGGWQYIVPLNGMRVYVIDEATEYLYDSTDSPAGWAPFAGGGGGGGGTVESVVGTTNQIDVDDADPANPIVELAAPVLTNLGLAASAVQPGDLTSALAALELNDLADVAGTPSTDDVLTFNGTSWVPAAAAGGSPNPLVPEPYTATHNMVLGDQYKGVTMNVATPNNFQIEPNSSVACDVGAVVMVTQIGTGQTTITAGGGVTLEYDSVGLLPNCRAQYSQISAWQRATDIWVLSGDMESV